jgi:hypothetical protein
LGSSEIFVDDLRTAKFAVVALGNAPGSPANEISIGTDPGGGLLGTL